MAAQTLRGRPTKQPSLLDLLFQRTLELQAQEQQSRKDALVGYADDPVRFVQDCIAFPEGQSLTPYQADILASLPVHKRVVVRSPHGAGKTSLAALMLLWFSLTSEALERDWKVITTAGAWRQLTKYLWPEVGKWARRIRWNQVGRTPFSPQTELLNMSLKLDYGEAFAVASDTPDLIEGAHATRIFYIFDEAKAIPPGIFDAAEGAISAGAPEVAYAFALSTPGPPTGRFYDLNTKRERYKDWHVRHVTAQEAIAAGRLDPQALEDRKRQWGENHPIYRNRMLGEFATDAAEGVIPLSWVELANQRWETWDAVQRAFTSTPHPELPITIGVDVARMGDDLTAIAFKRGHIVEWVRTYAKADVMETTGHAASLLLAHPSALAVVDTSGVGAGVTDRLREQKHNVEAFQASQAAPGTDKTGELRFLNRRAHAYWTLRELLDPAQEGGATLALPPDESLTEDLCSAKWTMTSAGRIVLESKEDVRKRLGRSPDMADAVVLACCADYAVPDVQFF